MAGPFPSTEKEGNLVGDFIEIQVPKLCMALLILAVFLFGGQVEQLKGFCHILTLFFHHPTKFAL